MQARLYNKKTMNKHTIQPTKTYPITIIMWHCSVSGKSSILTTHTQKKYESQHTNSIRFKSYSRSE